MKVGFVINPWAGIGGTVALKGSDGAEIRSRAIKLGAIPRANEKASHMLAAFFADVGDSSSVSWYTAPNEMGEDCLLSSMDPAKIHVQPRATLSQTESSETLSALQWFLAQEVDVIVFAGGDGTARNVYSVVGSRLPVLGIPAGVKIHSGVFANTAHAAGEVLSGLVNGSITELHTEEVRDINEQAFRENKVITKYFGEMNVPVSGEFMQHVKVGGIESEALVLNDIADWLQETLEQDVCYLVGSGRTTATLMEHLNLPNTLLGIDAIKNGEVIQADCAEQDLLRLLKEEDCRFILSIIGGQGHVLGRGNAQITPRVLNQIDKSKFTLIGTKAKLRSLEGRPLLVDTSDPDLDRQWAGLKSVVTGYNDQVIYPVVSV